MLVPFYENLNLTLQMHSHPRVHRSSQVQATSAPGPKKQHCIQRVCFCLPISFSKQTDKPKSCCSCTTSRYRYSRASRGIRKMMHRAAVRTQPPVLFSCSRSSAHKTARTSPGPTIISVAFPSKNERSLVCEPYAVILCHGAEGSSS